MQQRVLCFGDSITYGSGAIHGSWADKLKQRCNEIMVETNRATMLQAYNLGIGGETSKGLLQRVDQDVLARSSARWELRFTVAIGANDSRLLDGKEEVPLDEYTQNLTEIITKLKKYSDKIIVVGLTTIIDSKMPFKGTLFYSNSQSKKYNDAAKQVASSQGVKFADIMEKMQAEPAQESWLSIDGLHPDDNGHQWLYEQIKPVLSEILEVKL